MDYVVLIAWIVQGSVGLWLLIGWARHGRRHAGAILAHTALTLLTLALWIAFMATDLLAYAWAAWALLIVGIPFGETQMVRRSRGLRGITRNSAADYGRAVVDVIRGRMPPRVTFHALFAGVVFFSALAVCIGATVART